MNNKRRYTDKQLMEAIDTSLSIRSVLQKIGLLPTGGNYQSIKKRVKILNLDITHFTGKGHLKNKQHGWANKTPLNKLLVKNYLGGVSSHHLRQRLIKEGLIKKVCNRCGIDQWQGEELSLELEHKNGNKFDNRIQNLEVLCPNCHSLTTTYRRRK